MMAAIPRIEPGMPSHWVRAIIRRAARLMAMKARSQAQARGAGGSGGESEGRGAIGYARWEWVMSLNQEMPRRSSWFAGAG